MSLSKGSILTIDRAYIDYGVFQQFTDSGIIYVTKMKKNLVYKTLSSKYIVSPNGQVSMKISIVEFTKGEVKHTSRIVEYWAEGKKDSVRLLTNDMGFEPEQIIAIYDRRWQIELLFKQLKQNFPFKYFYGESVNAIESQIWVTMIANLLLTIVHKRINRKWAFSNMVTMIRQMLMYYIDLYAFLEDPEKAWNDALEELHLDHLTHIHNYLFFRGARHSKNKLKIPLLQES